MTENKQIIIDGVDVNALYSDQIACMNRYEVTKLFIKTVELLVAKEQECEALQMSENEAGEIIAELKAECERLKHDNGYEVGALEKTIDNLKAENEDYKERFDKLYSFNKQIISEKLKLGCQCAKLKQTLAEIKEIAEKDIAFCAKCNSDDNDKDCVACIEGGRALFAKDALKIISEVKNER